MNKLTGDRDMKLKSAPDPDHMPCGIIKLKAVADFPILYANEVFQRRYGGAANLREIVNPMDYADLEAEIRSHLGDVPSRFELGFKGIGETKAWNYIRFNYVPEEGDPVLYGIILDMTHEKKQREELLIQEVQYRMASLHSDRHVSLYDIPTQTLCQPPDLPFSLNLALSSPPSPDYLVKNGIIHRESVEEFLSFFISMEEGVPEGRCTIRIKMETGEYHWFSVCYSLICGQNGKPLRGVVSYQDITGQYEKELAYRKWIEYMKEQKKDCIGYYEYNLKYDLFEEIVGELTYNLPECSRNAFGDIIKYVAEHYIYEKDRKRYLEIFNRETLLNHYKEKNHSLQLEHRRIHSDGSIYWCLSTIQIVSDAYTDTAKAFILIKDVDEEKKAALSLKKLSERDCLTGLLNRGTAICEIRRILKSSQGHHLLLMLDIDRFKQLNDRYGHLMGDKALHNAALRLKSGLRYGDVFGRLGGDEFVLLLKDVPYASDLHPRLENLCGLVKGSLAPEAHISGSIGAAAFPEDGTAFEELYEKADIALYHAKRQGRNQYTLYEPGMCMEAPDAAHSQPLLAGSSFPL